MTVSKPINGARMHAIYAKPIKGRIDITLIPKWIAEHESPRIEKMNRIAVDIVKWSRRNEKAKKLTPDDIALAYEIWRENGMRLPDAENPISEKDFNKYDQAFNLSPKKPAWFLMPTFEDANLDQNCLHDKKFRAHLDKLRELIESGVIEAFDEHGVETKIMAYGVTISFKDAQDYLKKRWIELLDCEQAEAPTEIIQNGEMPAIPGKAQTTQMGQVMVKAALEIERERNRRATAGEVFSRLMQWIKEGLETDVLIKTKSNRCIVWRTTKNQEKDYSIDACGIALGRWNKSRH